MKFWLDAGDGIGPTGFSEPISAFGPASNTSIDLQNADGRPLKADFPPLARDLLDIAACYYRADELYARSKAADGWTRELELEVPVSDSTVWKKYGALVESMAEFLAGDKLRIRPRNSSGRAWYTGNHTRTIPTGFDVSCLFSGGIDSFTGAIGLLEQGKRVLLLGVKVDSNTARYQYHAYEYLLRKFPGQVEMVRFGVRAYGPSPKREETSHRSRSFLFLASASAISQCAGVQNVVCPENGLLSLNLPMDDSRLSSFSTRTAHPRFMTSFQVLVKQLGLGIKLANPHLHQTKSEVVALVDSKHSRALLETTSCSQHGQKWANTNAFGRRVDYCGTCMPCLHRSIAFDQAGLKNKPRFDVRGDFSILPATRTRDLISMAKLVRRVREADDDRLDGLMLSQGHFLPSASKMLGGLTTTTYRPWRRMLRRWVSEFDQFIEPMTAGSKAKLDVA